MEKTQLSEIGSSYKIESETIFFVCNIMLFKELDYH